MIRWTKLSTSFCKVPRVLIEIYGWENRTGTEGKVGVESDEGVCQEQEVGLS